MDIALSAGPFAAWRTADAVVAGGLFIWFALALVLSFAASARISMPLVAVAGLVGAVCLAILLGWVLAVRP